MLPLWKLVQEVQVVQVVLSSIYKYTSRVWWVYNNKYYPILLALLAL